MAIAEQFAGLDMRQLIGGPLSATADASSYLANSTADFIQKIGFEPNGKVRTVAFAYQRRSMNEDGTSNLDEMKVDIPMLAIVPIPNLQVDEVNILFDMEVKQSERSESAMDMSATVSSTLNFGIVKVSVTGSVSAHSTNTRSTDNSAKYHVDVRATNHGTPEGLARVLDMIAANVAPALVGSSLKDGNGQSLSEQARLKAEHLKGLRQDISQMESRLSVARDGFQTIITQLKGLGSSQRNVYQGRLTRMLNEVDTKGPDKENAEKQQFAYSQTMDEVNQSWGSFIEQAPELIKLLADSAETPNGVSKMFALKGLDEKGEAVPYAEKETYYADLSAVQKNAIESRRNIKNMEKELLEKKLEYSDAVAGRRKPEQPKPATQN